MNHARNPGKDRHSRSLPPAGMTAVLAKARDVLANSTAAEAKGFDVERWLDEWVEHPQPSLGGKTPLEFLDTPDGTEIVCRLIGAMESGAYL